jgi:hypothetical protein
MGFVLWNKHDGETGRVTVFLLPSSDPSSRRNPATTMSGYGVRYSSPYLYPPSGLRDIHVVYDMINRTLSDSHAKLSTSGESLPVHPSPNVLVIELPTLARVNVRWSRRSGVSSNGQLPRCQTNTIDRSNQSNLMRARSSCLRLTHEPEGYAMSHIVLMHHYCSQD